MCDFFIKVMPTSFCINIIPFLSLCQQNPLLNHTFQTNLQLSEEKKKKSQRYDRQKSNQV